jgi:methylase of polypeptide subunit release factors
LTLPSSPSHKRVISDDERAVQSIKDTRGVSSTLTQSQDLDAHGIDYLLGNPPYVSAGESIENLDYRAKI